MHCIAVMMGLKRLFFKAFIFQDPCQEVVWFKFSINFAMQV